MADIVDRLRTHDDARLYADADLLMAEAADEIERLRQRVKELEDYLREVAVEAGLPPETLDIATCRHIAHQVKAIRAASVQFMDELAELRHTRDHDLNAVLPLTHRKTSDIVKRDGYSITGFVLTKDDGLKCIVDMSAVRWMAKDDFFRMMHPDTAPKQEDKP